MTSSPPAGSPSSSPPRLGRGKAPLVAALAGVVALVVLAVVALTTVGDDVDSAAPQEGAVPPGSPATLGPTPSDQFAQVEVAVGECVDFLVATGENAQLVPVDCAAREASHVVVSEVASQPECPVDIDVSYVETRFGVAGRTLCLDVNWTIGTCFDITEGPATTEQVECREVPGRRIREVESVLRGTGRPEDCADIGIAYWERQIVVCLRPPG